MRKTFLILCASAITGFAWAQDSLRTTTLQEVVVSATRTEQSIIETPRSVTVINREAIEKTIYNSVGELLTSKNGIYVVGANQTPGTNQSLFIRGANSNQMVVMIDGIRITDPSSPSSTIDLAELSLTNVERIEIIRGSHSTIYGGAAIGGVINIITRKNQNTGLHGNVAVQAGTFGNGSSAFAENADLNFALKGGFYANGSVFQQNVNGLDASIKKNTGAFTTSDKDGFNKTDGFVKAGYKNKNWDAFAAYKKVHQLADIDGGAFDDDENNSLEFNRDLFEYRAGYKFNDGWSLAFLGSWSSSERINENDSSVVSEAGAYDHSYFKGTYHGKLQTHEVQINYEQEKLKGVLGAGVYREEMLFDTRFFYKDPSFSFESKTNYDSIDTSVNTGYVFGQLNYGIGDFNISAGLRFSSHSMAGNYWTAELNPSYRLNNTLIYASLSTGFNAPSLYQLYDPSKGFGSYTTRGNANLKSEQSLSVEAGLKKEFSTGSYFTFSAFETTVKNSIEYIYLWNGSKNISQLGFSDYRGDTYVNIAQQKVHGVELEGYVPIVRQVSLTGNLTWLSGKVLVNTSDISNAQTGGNHVQLYNFGTFLTAEYENDDLTRRPNLTAFAQLGYTPVSALTFNVSYRYAGSRFDVGYDFSLGPFGALKQSEVKSYNLVDFGANWRASKNFSIGLKIENILNENYSEVLGYKTRGRSGYLKLTARW